MPNNNKIFFFIVIVVVLKVEDPFVIILSVIFFGMFAVGAYCIRPIESILNRIAGVCNTPLRSLFAINLILITVNC